MNKSQPFQFHYEVSQEQVDRHKAIPTAEKLRMLDDMLAFFRKVAPAKSQKHWDEFRNQGKDF